MVPFRYTAEMTGQQSDVQKLTKGKTWLFTLTLRKQARVVLVANFCSISISLRNLWFFWFSH